MSTFLNADQVTAELDITKATLYAYVSRGLIRSEPDSDPRKRKYRAEDVKQLLLKKA